jgi:hypothetical protein
MAEFVDAKDRLRASADDLAADGRRVEGLFRALGEAAALPLDERVLRDDARALVTALPGVLEAAAAFEAAHLHLLSGARLV